MDSIGDISYNDILKDLSSSDILISIEGNKARISKNKYTIRGREELIDEDTILQIFVGFLSENCKVNFFLDSFKLDLIKEMKKVFKNYGLQIEFEE